MCDKNADSLVCNLCVICVITFNYIKLNLKNHKKTLHSSFWCSVCVGQKCRLISLQSESFDWCLPPHSCLHLLLLVAPPRNVSIRVAGLDCGRRWSSFTFTPHFHHRHHEERDVSNTLYGRHSQMMSGLTKANALQKLNYAKRSYYLLLLIVLKVSK